MKFWSWNKTTCSHEAWFHLMWRMAHQGLADHTFLLPKSNFFSSQPCTITHWMIATHDPFLFLPKAERPYFPMFTAFYWLGWLWQHFTEWGFVAICNNYTLYELIIQLFNAIKELKHEENYLHLEFPSTYYNILITEVFNFQLIEIYACQNKCFCLPHPTYSIFFKNY